MNILEVKNLSFNATHQIILQQINLTIEKGRSTILIGQSGSGKTSLLKCMVGLIQNYQGNILLQGKEVKSLPPQERVNWLGFVAQGFHLFPFMNILENCMHPLQKVFKKNYSDAKQKALEVLSELKIEHLAHAYPSTLSGGQQQRAAIARALVMDSKILMMDEPTSALDPNATANLHQLLQQLQERGLTLVITSHDMNFVKKFKDRVFFLEQGLLVESWDFRHSLDSCGTRIQSFLDMESN
ncbi:MAG TPA: ATP-binding cassette domain-containing protein [Gammaproteobacteria bacterium]|nr:ATP-binding cassette domain-containing protein [Gammaproteobacteria bacterium]